MILFHLLNKSYQSFSHIIGAICLQNYQFSPISDRPSSMFRKSSRKYLQVFMSGDHETLKRKAPSLTSAAVWNIYLPCVSTFTLLLHPTCTSMSQSSTGAETGEVNKQFAQHLCKMWYYLFSNSVSGTVESCL